MNRVTPKVRCFAQRLVVYEATGNRPSEIKSPAAFDVFEKLRPHLAMLMGSGGYRALLSRAVTLGIAHLPWLRGVQVKSDGALAGLDELRTQLAPEEMAEGQVVLLGQLFGLLVTFIGESLTVRVVHEVWPQLTLDDSDLESENGNKK
jgi:hypothetical protein